MKTYSTPILSAAGAGGIVSRILLWVKSRDRTTSAIHETGFWTGDDHMVFNIGGVDRTYVGAGALISVPRITYSSGFTDSRAQVDLASSDDSVIQAVRQYDVRLAPVELHKVFLDPFSLQPVGTPILIMKGTVDQMPERRPAMGQSGAIFEMKITTDVRKFSRTLALRNSDSSIKAATGDRFGRYLDLTGKVVDTWG